MPVHQVEVTGAAGTTGVCVARHVTLGGSDATGCVRALENKAIPVKVQEKRSVPAMTRNALVSDFICVLFVFVG